MNERPLKVTAILSAPIAGDVPMLDALLEWQMAMKAESIARDDANGRHSKWLEWRESVLPGLPRHSGFLLVPSRDIPAPPPGCLPIGIVRTKADGWPVARASSPIYAARREWVERVSKRLDGGTVAALGDPDGRAVVNHATGGTKDYYLPVRVRDIPRVVWFAVGYGFLSSKGRDKEVRRRSAAGEMRKQLKGITALGAYRGAGYGRVAQWTVEEIEADLSWYAPSADGPVLMRPLPAKAVPAEAVGWRATRCAVCGPYWHPDNRIEAKVPC